MVLPLDQNESLIVEQRRRKAALIENYRSEEWKAEAAANPEFCDFLRKQGYDVPDDWPTLKKKDKS